MTKILLFVTWDALHYLYSCLISFLFPFLWAMQLIKLTSGFSSHWTSIKFCDKEKIWDWLYLKVLLAKTNDYSLVKKNAYSCGELSHPTLQDPYQKSFIFQPISTYAINWICWTFSCIIVCIIQDLVCIWIILIKVQMHIVCVFKIQVCKFVRTLCYVLGESQDYIGPFSVW